MSDVLVLHNLTKNSQKEFIFVNYASDLPPPVDGVITLEPYKTYYITTTIDLDGSRLVAGANTTILGASSENCRIKSTGLTDALITSEWSLPIRNITLEADLVLDLDATGNTLQALDWNGVNFNECALVGTIKNYNNFIAHGCAFLNSQGLTFDGAINTIAFTDTLFDNRTSGTSIIIPATATVSRRFRIMTSAFISLSGETAINVSTSASLAPETYILNTVDFSGGGTYTAGVQYNDNKAIFSDTKGVTHSANLGMMYWTQNAQNTIILQTTTPTKIVGTSAPSDYSQRFSHDTSGRLTYTGTITRLFSIETTLSFTSGNNQLIDVYIAKNGSIIQKSESRTTTSGSGRAENIKVQTIVDLAPTEFIEIFIENHTSTNSIVVVDLNCIVQEI